MTTTTQVPAHRSAGTEVPPHIEHVDILLIGAGISGIGGASHLRQQAPQRSFLILDEQQSFGGTWHTHRFPGIRSDSDLYTFGYRFKPWMSAPIATAAEIRSYLGETIVEHRLQDRIRYGHKVLTASWCSKEARWTVRGMQTETGAPFVVTARFLWMGQGYYRHDQGYAPQWPGIDSFQGPIVHPQRWPDELQVAGKRVIVIGSGATAATIVPALADLGAQVTMLQRSPTYFFCGRNANELSDLLRSLDVPDTWRHEIVRRKLLQDQRETIRRAMEEPDALRADLLAGVLQQLGSEEALRQHFTPDYGPWRQRLALVPDGDLFKAIRDGKATVVTDEIEHFESDGIRVKSGQLLEADIVVSATGLELLVMGGIAFEVDGAPVDFAQTVAYRGAMFTGVPNLLSVFGYLRSSWTLRVDLLADFFCRLLAHMDDIGATTVVPQLRAQDADMQILPWIEPENFNPGYLMRAMHMLPRQGNRAPWRHTQDYWTDREELPVADLDDGSLRFESVPAQTQHASEEDAQSRSTPVLS